MITSTQVKLEDNAHFQECQGQGSNQIHDWLSLADSVLFFIGICRRFFGFLDFWIFGIWNLEIGRSWGICQRFCGFLEIGRSWVLFFIGICQRFFGFVKIFGNWKIMSVIFHRNLSKVLWIFGIWNLELDFQRIIISSKMILEISNTTTNGKFHSFITPQEVTR